MKPSVLAASIEKRLLPRVAKMRRAGLEPQFSRDFRSVAVLTDAEFKVGDVSCEETIFTGGNPRDHSVYEACSVGEGEIWHRHF